MKTSRFIPAAALACALAAGTTAWATGGDDEKFAYSPELAALNVKLREAGIKHVRIDRAEILVSDKAYTGQATTILANDRTHLFPVAFVENDERRPSPANTITYLVDQSQGLALSFVGNPPTSVIVLPNAVTEAEIDASMAAWGAMNCNPPNIMKIPDSGADPDLADGLILGQPGLIGTPFADVTHAGWLPAGFFNALVPNGANFILGVTLTFVFQDDDGNDTDVDRNGLPDAAFSELYYNQSFPWGTDFNPNNVDIQSVVIHEAGHAFGLGHFGKIFQKADGTIQFAPKAIMNAGYVFADRSIRGTDKASFCQVWANKH